MMARTPIPLSDRLNIQSFWTVKRLTCGAGQSGSNGNIQRLARHFKDVVVSDAGHNLDKAQSAAGPSVFLDCYFHAERKTKGKLLFLKWNNWIKFESNVPTDATHWTGILKIPHSSGHLAVKTTTVHHEPDRALFKLNVNSTSFWAFKF